MVVNRYFSLLPQQKAKTNFRCEKCFYNAIHPQQFDIYSLQEKKVFDVWEDDQLMEVASFSRALTQYACHNHLFFHCHPSHIIQLKNLPHVAGHMTSRNQGPFERKILKYNFF